MTIHDVQFPHCNKHGIIRGSGCNSSGVDFGHNITAIKQSAIKLLEKLVPFHIYFLICNCPPKKLETFPKTTVVIFQVLERLKTLPKIII